MPVRFLLEEAMSTYSYFWKRGDAMISRGTPSQYELERKSTHSFKGEIFIRNG